MVYLARTDFYSSSIAATHCGHGETGVLRRRLRRTATLFPPNRKARTMNTRKFIAASLLALAAAPAAFAQQAPAEHAVTRASVVAELQRARAAGELEPGEQYGLPAARSAPSAVSRSAVVAELDRARKAGELRYVDTRETGFPTVTAPQATERTRAEVKAELQAAMRSGALRTVGERS